MSFEISDTAQLYYRRINEGTYGKFKIQFDFYYLCFIIGMLNLRLKKLDSSNELLRNFPSEYYKQRYHIIGLLLDAEIRRTGINTSDRDGLEKFVLRLVSMDNPNHLSDEGEKILNKYAEGGFQLIYEEIGLDYDYTTFMIKYNDLIKKSKL